MAYPLSLAQVQSHPTEDSLKCGRYFSRTLYKVILAMRCSVTFIVHNLSWIRTTNVDKFYKKKVSEWKRQEVDDILLKLLLIQMTQMILKMSYIFVQTCPCLCFIILCKFFFETLYWLEIICIRNKPGKSWRKVKFCLSLTAPNVFIIKCFFMQ